MRTSYAYEVEDLEFEGRTYGLTMELDVTMSPFDPGVNWGPPEGCYPPEGGEIEDCDVIVEAASSSDRPNESDAVIRELQAEVNRQVKDGGPLWDRIQAFIYDQPPPEPDYDEFVDREW